jgi:hypothetical protein
MRLMDSLTMLSRESKDSGRPRRMYLDIRGGVELNFRGVVMDLQDLRALDCGELRGRPGPLSAVDEALDLFGPRGIFTSQFR